jgi:hypothetical protein
MKTMTDVQEPQSQLADDEPQIETLEDRKQRSREMIPVLPGRGLSPDNYAAYVTVAQGMCKPDNILLKTELRSNVAVVIGLLDIAARAKLSPYLLSMKCYVQKGVLCFESQAFHALARPFLDGGLKGEYLGEGQERELIIRGRLRGDPYEYEHKSPKLKDLHPGHSVKEVNGERLQFVKGSPLWDRKPDVQLWYDTTRDWVRLHCPEAVLGLYTTDEVEAEDFRDVTPRPTLGERLAASPRPELREGFRPMEVGTSLDQAEGDDRVAEAMADTPIQPKGEGGPAARLHMGVNFPAEHPPKLKRVRKRPGKPTKAAKPKAGPKPRPKRKPRQQPAPPAQEAPPDEGVDPADAYVAQAEAWIAAATNPDEAEARWDAEYDARNAAEVAIDDRNRLRAVLDERCAQLRGQK